MIGLKLSSPAYGQSGDSALPEQTQLYSADLILGLAKRLSKKLIWKPYLTVKGLSNDIVDHQISNTLSFNQRISLGIGVRNLENLNLLTHLFVRKNLRIGYSYEMDVTTSKIKKLNTHEFFMGLNVGREKGELVSPRFYDL